MLEIWKNSNFPTSAYPYCKKWESVLWREQWWCGRTVFAQEITSVAWCSSQSSQWKCSQFKLKGTKQDKMKEGCRTSGFSRRPVYSDVLSLKRENDHGGSLHEQGCFCHHGHSRSRSLGAEAASPSARMWNCCPWLREPSSRALLSLGWMLEHQPKIILKPEIQMHLPC